MPSSEVKTLRNRPQGVTVVVFLLILYAATLAIALVTALTHPQMVRSWMTPSNSGKIAIDVAVFLPLRILITLVLSFGLWQLHDWARRGIIVCAALSMAPGLIAILHRTETAGSNGNGLYYIVLIRLLLVIGIVGYLLSPGVANAFVVGDEVRG